jgi:hypothetical protein
MKMQKFVPAVPSLNSHMNIGITREIAAGSAFAPRQLRSQVADAHTHPDAMDRS